MMSTKEFSNGGPSNPSPAVTSALAGCRQSGCPVPPLTTTRPRILSNFLKACLSTPGVELVLQVAGEEFVSRLSLLNNAISDTIATKGMRREIFFQSVSFLFVVVFSLRVVPAVLGFSPTTYPFLQQRATAVSLLPLVLSCFFLSSPFRHPPPCKHPSLCPRILFSVS